MIKMQASKLSPIILGLIILVTLQSQAISQERKPADREAAPPDPVINFLLNEVRQLRMALERTNLVNYRAQVTVTRLRMQQERVDRLARELDEVRDDINEMKAEQPRVVEMVKEMENQTNREAIGGTIDSNTRAQMEIQLKVMKAEADRFIVREAQLRERETSLANQLHAEQAKLSELETKLDLLERELEMQQNDGVQRPATRRR